MSFPTNTSHEQETRVYEEYVFFVFVDLRCCRSFSVSQRDFGLWCTASESSLRTMATTVTPDVAAVDGELQKEVSTGSAASTDEAALATVDTQCGEPSAPAEKVVACRHGQLLLHISKLLLRTRTAATRIFQRTNEKTFVHWASLPNACLPTWISSKDDTFIALP